MCKELKLHNSYGELNKAIIAWAKTYLNEDKNIAHVAISRKAPRLLEWCKQHGVSSNVDIITELALPFENWSKYKDCILTDEAIYHGTTFSKVMTLVVEAMHRWSLGKAFPLFLTSDAMEVEVISKRLLHGCHLLASSDIPFFVDSIISKFFDLGKPYDIEYPLFYIDFKDELSDDTIEFILGNLSEAQKYSCYKSSNYVRELNCYINNYTLRTDSFSENSKLGVSVPDFAKLRFFKKGNRLCVASMVPYRIPDSYICRNSSLFDGTWSIIWNSIYSQAEQNTNSLEENSRCVSEEYCYQMKKSLAVMANYLFSYQYFLTIQDALREAIGKLATSDFYTLHEDLQYLVGTELVDSVKELLKLCHYNGGGLSNYHTQISNVDFVIPLNYQVDYNYQMAIDNQRQPGGNNADLLLSSMFSAMHWKIEIASRKLEHSDYSRLRFGETYASMLDRFSKHWDDKHIDLLNEIHKGIDVRIDHGSVVPNYVRTDEGVNSGWVRMFRSGENEDSNKDQMLRTLLTLVSLYMSETQSLFVSLIDLELFLSHIYLVENHVDVLPRRVFSQHWCPVFNQDAARYEMAVEISGKKIPMLEWAIESNVLSEDSFGEITIEDNEYARNLALGSILDEETLGKLKEIAKSSKKRMDNCKQMYVDTREYLNFLFYTDEHIPMAKDIHFQMLELCHLIKDDIQNDELVKRMALECDTLFWRFPDTDLDFYQEGVTYKDFELIFKEKYDSTIKKCGQDVMFFYVVTNLKYFWNLWYHYKTKGNLYDYDYADFEQFVDWLDGEDKSFADGTRMADWFRPLAEDLDNILSVPYEDIRSKMLELLIY